MSSPPNLRRVGEQLHARLLTGESLIVTGEIADIFLPILLRSLHKLFWNLSDPHLVNTAAEDALIEYFDNPARYHPARSGLFTYLRLLGKNRVLDLLAGQKGLQSKEQVVELEGLGLVYRDEAHEVPDPEAAIVQRDAHDQTMEQLREILPDPRDLEMVKMMMEGVRETDRYAEILNVTDRPPEEQKSIVKRHKDRLKKTVQRKYKRGV